MSKEQDRNPQTYAEMIKGAGQWWQITITHTETGATDTVTVKADTEGRAKSTAMAFTTLQAHGALLEFAAAPIAEPA